MQTRIIELRHTSPDSAFQKALQLALADKSANVAVDSGRKLVTVVGDREALEVAESMIRKLDERRPDPPAEEYRLRLVWLATGIPAQGTDNPPTDLREVLTELAALDIKEPRLVSQLMVNISSGQQFQAQGQATLGTPCQLLVRGTLGPGGGSQPTIRLHVDALQMKTNQAICRLDTTMTAPLRHFVLLGVTPTDNSTLIFVVQLLPK